MNCSLISIVADDKCPLFCPKPRRPIAPLRCHQSSHPNASTGNHQSSHPDANAGMDMLDLLFSKVGSFGLLVPRSTIFLCNFLLLFSDESLMFSPLILRRGRRETSLRRDHNRRCSMAHRWGGHQTQSSTTAGSARTTLPCWRGRWWSHRLLRSVPPLAQHHR
ncbi:hypothetical protein GUJ93_ZPchr0013g35591 [Zizania palustris]|uniref:Uncharacterized protein n=1 Tax=Zizania palustris TaxID=103762 RepID=A0A8J6BXV9_ZIZPA|nr:hypothetical protein GUJ93_ZPchr0013g35591 [Zizania palustris]